jgi:hypothetical protein
VIIPTSSARILVYSQKYTTFGTSSARILVYSQKYTTFGPPQLAFQCTVNFTGLSSLSESPLRALSATHILFCTTTGTAVLQSAVLLLLQLLCALVAELGRC